MINKCFTFIPNDMLLYLGHTKLIISSTDFLQKKNGVSERKKN